MVVYNPDTPADAALIRSFREGSGPQR